MNVKRIDEKLRKAIMMAYQYQINCELTPSQCKELIDYIDNPLELEEVCEWKKDKRHFPYSGVTYFMYVTKCDYEYDDDKVMADWVYCPSCGKRIVYKESE